jgi:hypothetical protein
LRFGQAWVAGTLVFRRLGSVFMTPVVVLPLAVEVGSSVSWRWAQTDLLLVNMALEFVDLKIFLDGAN